ncbi:glycosyltransferase family 4 protein [Patescibacteria group bacterium]|nr:glycosyltransferase family 4 protein [Patescibacteria group bacterium]MBU1256770.1 glycosyltransferase family 4 protein [Patescibacteria group bacterium]MBU1457221.1 glycosyltransferase family 4 protein [Patescibacteria group bacterium]
MNNIKLQLNSGIHSKGRGVGFYAENLTKALAKNPSVILACPESNQIDIVHYTYFDLFYPTLPFNKTHPTVVTIHDLTPLILPHLYPKGLKGTFNLIRQRLSLLNVSAIITDSQNSRRDLIKLFMFSPEKVFVTPLAADKIYKTTPSPISVGKIKSKFNLPEKFILTVAGGPNPNKNLPALAEATKALKIPLVVVGGGMTKELPPGKTHKELKDLVKLKSYSHIITPGFISNKELLAFYSLATLYCQPSLYEGFGLPVLEAMHAGCLLVSSNTSSLSEIYPPGTITFDPQSQDSLQNALTKAFNLTQKQRNGLVNNAKEVAKQFSWKKTAQKTIDVYTQVLSQ